VLLLTHHAPTELEQKRHEEEDEAARTQPGMAGYERKMAARAALFEAEREQAAARIQAVFRGHTVRKSLQASVLWRTAKTQEVAAARVQKKYAEDVAARYSNTMLSHSIETYHDTHDAHDLHNVVAKTNAIGLPGGSNVMISAADVQHHTPHAAPRTTRNADDEYQQLSDPTAGYHSHNKSAATVALTEADFPAQEASDEAMFRRLMSFGEESQAGPAVSSETALHAAAMRRREQEQNAHLAAMRQREQEEHYRMRRDVSAATTIQAVYRGHKSRRDTQQLQLDREVADLRQTTVANATRDRSQRLGVIDDTDSEGRVESPETRLGRLYTATVCTPQHHLAAIAIQALYRGHRVRRRDLQRMSTVRPTVGRIVDLKLESVRSQKAARAQGVAMAKLQKQKPRMTVVAGPGGLELKQHREEAAFVPQSGPASRPKDKASVSARVYESKKHKAIGRKLLTDDMGNLVVDHRKGPAPAIVPQLTMTVGPIGITNRRSGSSTEESDASTSSRAARPASGSWEEDQDIPTLSGPEFWPSGHRRIAYVTQPTSPPAPAIQATAATFSFFICQQNLFI
jgi:hypothetical protein